MHEDIEVFIGFSYAPLGMQLMSLCHSVLFVANFLYCTVFFMVFLRLFEKFKFNLKFSRQRECQKKEREEYQSMAEDSADEWRSPADFLNSDTFARVLDFLGLEDVARLMMCSRSLRETGKGAKDWRSAVMELSSQNGYNTWEGDPFDDFHNFFAAGAVPDPRIKPGFESKACHKQFGLLFVFQRDCVNNLLRCYDLDDLDECSSGRYYFKYDDPDTDYGPWMWRYLQGINKECQSRIILLDRIAQLTLAQ